MTIPDSALFAAAVAERRFWIAVGIAMLAGLVRGFSGFGAAQIYIPLVAAVYGARVAAVTLLLIDTVGTAPFTVRAFAHCAWREVLPMYVCAAIAIPLGTFALLVIDPIILRWFIAVLVLSLVGILFMGWRYHGRASLPVTAGLGIISGLATGAAQMGGPPVLIYWLGVISKAITVRANCLVYFLLLDLTSCAVYLWHGLISPQLLALSLLLAVPFFVATAAGATLFHGSSDLIYRRIAYAVIAAAAFVSLPAFDSFLR